MQAEAKNDLLETNCDVILLSHALLVDVRVGKDVGEKEMERDG
jgi:hypothetical protein